MGIAEVIDVAGGQVVKLPEEFHIDSGTVAVRREGESLVLEPIRTKEWPEGFFEAIRIDDPKFVRPDQGQMPPA